MSQIKRTLMVAGVAVLWTVSMSEQGEQGRAQTFLALDDTNMKESISTENGAPTQTTHGLNVSFIQYNLAGEEAAGIVEKDLAALVGELDKDMYVITSQETGADAFNTHLPMDKDKKLKKPCVESCERATVVYDAIEDSFRKLSTRYVKLSQQLNGFIGIIIFVKKSLENQFTNTYGYKYDYFTKYDLKLRGNAKGSASITVDFTNSSQDIIPLHFTSLHLPAHEGAINFEERKKCLARIIEKSLSVSEENCKKKKEGEQQCLENRVMAFNGDHNWRVEVPTARQEEFYGKQRQGWNPADYKKKGDKKTFKCIKAGETQAKWLEDMRDFDEGKLGLKDIYVSREAGGAVVNLVAPRMKDLYPTVVNLVEPQTENLYPSFKPVEDPDPEGKRCYTANRQPSWTDRVTFLPGPKVHLNYLAYGTSHPLYGSDHFPVVAYVTIDLKKAH